MALDVVWTAEFAAKGWIHPLKGPFALDTSTLLPADGASATYNGTLYAAPYASDGGLLYYRKDLVPNPPKTWDQLIADCRARPRPARSPARSRPATQGSSRKYEGLTVNAAEAINAAGGAIVGPDGKTATVDSPQSAPGCSFLVNGFKQGYIPKEALGFQETQSLNAFSAGQLMFMRNWPYAVADPRRQGLEGHRQVRHRAAARHRGPRRVQPRWSQRRASAPTPSTRRPTWTSCKFLESRARSSATT